MANPREVNVDVVLQPDCDPPFHMSSDLLDDGRLTFNNNNHPGFVVNFHLQDPTNSGYVFPNDPDQALWCQVIHSHKDECPKTAVHWDQFEATKVKDKNMTLVVRNVNKMKAQFGYTLRVTKSPDGTGEFLDLDPIGSNQNGPTGFSRSLYTAAAAAVVGVAVLYSCGLLTA